jgi:SAM-dependent methyltransferase
VPENAASTFLCRSCGAASPARGDAWSCACGAAFAAKDGIWQVDALEPAGFSAASRGHLASFEEDHFWFAGRQLLLLACLDRLPEPPRRAIDLGCGNGRFLAALAERGAAVTGVDAYADSLARAKARAPAATLLAADVTAVPLEDAGFDLVAALDVLEHLEPSRLLAEARRLLAPGGRLLLSVPAFASLWSVRDERAGHLKRYRRRLLEAELAASGFALEFATHYQFLLFPLVWLSRRLDAKSPLPLERRPPGPLGRLLGAVNRLEVGLWGRRSLPWGSSLVALARPAEAVPAGAVA